MAFCNPATHDYKFTPFPRPAQDILSDLCMVKKYPCRVSYGFGFHKIENEEAEADRFDYKIVVVINWGAQLGSFKGFVYSLRAGEWKRVADYIPSPRGQLLHRSVEGLFTRGDEKGPEIAQDLELCPQRFFKGCWHWMAKASDNGRYSVLSYDFRDEVFRLIGGPAGYMAHSDATTHVKGGVLLLNDHLAAIYLTHNELHCVGIDVWMMMEYGVVESWARIYTIMDFSGELCRLVGVTARPLRDDENSNESGGIRIERVFFQSNGARIVSFDAFGYDEHCVCDTSSFICWNTLGISSYKETFERL